MQRSSLVFDSLWAGIVWVGGMKDHLDRCGTCRNCSGILTSQRGTGLTLDRFSVDTHQTALSSVAGELGPAGTQLRVGGWRAQGARPRAHVGTN